MFLSKSLKVNFISLLVIFLGIKNAMAMENKILFKVDNEIITTIDIFEEIKFLKSFNPEMNNLSKTELFEISKNSLLKNKIKKIEIMKFVKEFKVEDKFLQNIIKNKYSKIGINSLENFADVSKCHGKKDGVSGCRTCCDQNYTDNYYQCVYECM